MAAAVTGAEFRVTEKQQNQRKKGGGRPFKFAEPSRPITLTLPDRTLRELEKIDPDRGRAIVKLAEEALGDGSTEKPLVQIVEMAANTGLVMVGPNQVLRRISFVRLVEVAPSRYLLAVVPGHDFHQLEIAITDLLEEVPEEEVRERELIRQLLGHIKDLRKADRVSMAEILLVQSRPGGRS